jgi:hypothetical protein
MTTDLEKQLSLWGHSYKSWHLPISQNHVVLREALADMHLHSHGQGAIPLIIQLVENPRFRLPGLELFHGSVDLDDHDCIHILLGRGMLPKDEAFVIGFTMGSTGQVGSWEEKLYSLISQYLYPDVYKFKKDDLEIFRDGLHLGMVCRSDPLDKTDFTPLMDKTLEDVRNRLGIDTTLLKAYYALEAKRYPYAQESIRLLN